MKHYSKVLKEQISIGKDREPGLVHYDKQELEITKTLRRVVKNDKDFAGALKTVHELKRAFNARIKDWEIPWQLPEENQKTPLKEVSVSESFWTLKQQDYSKIIAEEIKSRTKAGKSASRLKSILSADERAAHGIK